MSIFFTSIQRTFVRCSLATLLFVAIATPAFASDALFGDDSSGFELAAPQLRILYTASAKGQVYPCPT